MTCCSPKRCRWWWPTIPSAHSLRSATAARGSSHGDKPFTFEAYGIAVAPGDQLFENLLNNFLTILKGSGQMQILDRKWFKNAAWMKKLAK